MKNPFKDLLGSSHDKSNWEKVSDTNYGDSVRGRDVYSEQQLDRGKRKEKMDETPFKLGILFLTVLCFFVIYFIVASYQYYDIVSKVVASKNLSILSALFGKVKMPISFNQLLFCSATTDKMFWYLLKKLGFRMLITFPATLLSYMMIKATVMRRYDVINIMSSTDDINQHTNDQHIALPEEILERFDIFPDVGAHSSVDVTCIVSHFMLSKKGLPKVKLARRLKEDILDEDGNVIQYKKDFVYDKDGNMVFDTVDMIDEPFGEELWSSAEIPKDDKASRRRFDATIMKYNPGNKFRDKMKNCETIADLIKKDWKFPYYEPQRPAGAYAVATTPDNNMVLAMKA